MSWDGPTAEWWREEVGADPVYARDVDPLLEELLDGVGPGSTIDLGCGDGRLLGRHAAVGVDRSTDLVSAAARRGSAVVADVGCLPFATGAWIAAYAVLVLEHVADPVPLFAETARIVAPGGILAIVVNHPVYTAPGAGPFVDPADGEVLWRWGAYLQRGAAAEPAGGDSIVFHHRPLGDLLTTAASAGWQLERLVEHSLDPAGDALLAAQTDVPRLLGARWKR